MEAMGRILRLLPVLAMAVASRLAAQAPLEMHVQGRGETCSLGFSPDGRLVAAGGTLNKIRLYDTRTGMEMRILRHVERDSGIGETESNPMMLATRLGAVGAVRFCPDGKRFLAGCENGAIQVWDAESGSLVRVLGGHQDRVNCLAVSADGKRAFSGSDDRTLIEWDLDAGKPLRVYEGHGDGVTCLDVAAGGELLVSGSHDGTVRLWQTASGRLLATLRGHAAGVSGVAFCPDGRRIASCSEDLVSLSGGDIREGDGAYVRIWDGSTGAQVAGFVTPVDRFSGRPECAMGIGWTRDGKQLFVAAREEILLLDAVSGTAIRRYAFAPDERGSYRTCLSPDGSLLGYGGSDGAPTLLSIPSLDGRRRLGGPTPVLNDCRLSRDGKRILFENGRLSLWDADDLRRTEPQMDGKARPASALCLSPRGDAFFSADPGSLAFWRILPDGTTPIYQRYANRGSWAVPAWSPDGSLLAVGMEAQAVPDSAKGGFSSSPPGTARIGLYDAASGKALPGLDLEKNNRIGCLEFSADGRLLFAGTRDGKLRAWSVPGWKPAWTVDTGWVELQGGPYMQVGGAVEFLPKRLTCSPDGRYLAAVGEARTLLVWEAATGKPVRFSAEGDGTYLDAVFSAGGGLVAATVDGRILFLDLATGRTLRTLEYGAAPVFRVSISADGSRLLSGQTDGTMRLWDLATGRWTTLMDDAAGERWIAYSDDGYWDASREGGSLVAMVRGLSCWNVDQFAVRNNRPDILLSRGGAASRELVGHFRAQYEKRLKRLGLSEDALRRAGDAPEARIVRTASDGRKATLEISFFGAASDLASYNIHVNGVPLFGAYGRPLAGRSADIVEEVELTPGPNMIEAGCRDAAGTESLRAAAAADGLPAGKPDLYFLGFGVSGYLDSRIDLKYADKDVRDLAALFSQMGSGAFDRVYAKTYLNREVTAETIRQAGSLLKGAKPDDTFVLFISGHGMHDGDAAATYYYLTYDTDLKNLKGTAADYDLIEGLLQGIAPRHKLFLMDTCESGEIEDSTVARYDAAAGGKGLRPRTARALEAKGLNVAARSAPAERRWYLLDRQRFIYNDLVRRSGAIVFSSCRGGEFSYEGDAAVNGYFTRALIDALKTGKTDGNGDGTVQVEEWKSQVAASVAAMTSDLQHPTVDRDNIHQGFGFPLMAGR